MASAAAASGSVSPLLLLFLSAKSSDPPENLRAITGRRAGGGMLSSFHGAEFSFSVALVLAIS